MLAWVKVGDTGSGFRDLEIILCPGNSLQTTNFQYLFPLYRAFYKAIPMAPRRKRQKLDEDGEAVTAALAGLTDEFHQPETGETDATTKSAPTKNTTSLFVRSLPEGATTESLAAFFSESYPLKHATVVTDRATKKSKGYGFVTFADPEDAIKAKTEFDGTIFEGKKLKVELAEARHRDAQDEGNAPKTKLPRGQKLQADSDEPQHAPRLIIRNLPWSMKTPEQLIALFQSYGKVKSASLPTAKKGLSSGFGFVLLRGRKNAEKAIAGLNGKEVDGREITVDYAMDKTTWETHQSAEKKKKDVIDLVKDDPSGDTEIKDEESSGSDVDTGGGVLILSDDEDKPELDEDDSDVDNSDVDELDDDEEDDIEEQKKPEDYSGKLFIRNLPFTATDESLSAHFAHFGPVQYARVVMDHETDRSRGTAFVCFRNPDDATTCVREAPKAQMTPQVKDSRANNKRSILEDTQVDPFGHYTLEGRILQISRAVDRKEANRLEVEGQSVRETRDRDKRRLFLLSEGTVSEKSSLYSTLSQTERKMREDSSKQRHALIKSNPLLHLSLTRLSIRNIPRHITSKDLKALARQAVVGFATDLKASRRQPLTKEELSRGGEEMKQAERDRKIKGKGVVQQAKIVFEGREGSKVTEKSGAGKSRGYGFIEYSSHRWALMGLRWLNGHLIKRDNAIVAGKSGVGQDTPDKSRRLIVEFAIENAQVVARRQTRQQRPPRDGQREHSTKDERGKKRKAETGPAANSTPVNDKSAEEPSVVKISLAAKNMIGKKRAIRKARRSG